MEITRKAVDFQEEQNMLFGMLTSDRFLKWLSTIYDPGLVESPHVRVVGRWCLEYWQKYGTAPQKTVYELFKAWEETVDSSVAVAVKSMLDEIFQKAEFGDKFNVDYHLDKAERKFRKRSLNELSLVIQEAIRQGALDEAEQAVLEYRRVQRPRTEAIDPFTDAEKIVEAFSETVQPMFGFQGDLGEFLNHQLCRGNFIGIMAPDKRGKSLLLQEFAIRAAFCGCRVALFQAGDMTEAQTHRRLIIHAAKRSDKEKYCGPLLIPVLDCAKNQTGECNKTERACHCSITEVNDSGETVLMDYFDAPSDYIPCTYCKKHKNNPNVAEDDFKGAVWYNFRPAINPLTAEEAIEVGKVTDASMNGCIRLSVHPSRSISATGIDNLIQTWEDTDGFVPDVIVIDYADLLEPERKQDFRHEQNETWMKLRQVSQRRHCLLITATQTNASAYDSEIITQSNFSEDKRKLAHVTGMLGINQTEEEKEKGLYRLNWVVLRDDEYFVRKCVHVLTCPKIGRAFLGSFF